MLFAWGDSYLILKIMGIIVFISMGAFSLVRQGISSVKAVLVCSVAVIAAFDTSRVWYIVQHTFGREPYSLNHWDVVWGEAGSVLYGWIVGGFLAIYGLCRLLKLPVLKVTDSLAIWMLAAQILNRLGCSAAGCCYGKPLNAPWALYNPYVGMTLHPVQLYEAVFDTILIFIVQAQAKNAIGRRTLVYFIGYSSGRFFLEFFRGDNLPALFGLTVPQLTSTLILLSLFFIWLAKPDRPQDIT